jgi:hypothetical protein
VTSAQPDWVVTYTIEFANSDIMVTEFFRGCHAECLRIRAQSGGGEHDMQVTKRPWKPIIGPAHEWDDFLRS